jgi:hypothetical protein
MLNKTNPGRRSRDLVVVVGLLQMYAILMVDD